MMKKTVFFPIILLLVGKAFAFKPTKNLEEFGFSPQLESYRQKVTLDFNQELPEGETGNRLPSPVLPTLEDNYSDLVPPPTQPKVRTFYQPTLADNVPKSRAEFVKDRQQRVRDYKRPPDFNDFLQNHKNIPTGVYGITESGLSGLFRTVTANTLDRQHRLFSANYSRIFYDYSFGQKVNKGTLEKHLVQLGATSHITDRFEAALIGDIVNEKAVNFPILNDFEKTELEQLSMQAKYQWLNNPSRNLKAAFGFGVENAMGKQVTRRGSDGTSYSGFVSLTRDYEKFSLHGQVGLTVASGVNSSGNEHPNSLFYNFAADAPVSTNTRLMLEFNGLDWSGFGNNLDFTLGLRHQIREEFSVQMAIPISILQSQFPYDYSYYASIGCSIKI